MEIVKIFPVHIREALANDTWKAGLEEIRVRVGSPLEFIYGGESRYLPGREGAYALPSACGYENGYRMTPEDLREMLNYISDYSLYAYSEEVKEGYLTIEGGHRIGMAGQVVKKDGKVTGLSHITFLNVRIAHEKRGCADDILPHIRRSDGIYNTLMLSPPGIGKTTFLRDLIRQLSAGDAGAPGMKWGLWTSVPRLPHATWEFRRTIWAPARMCWTAVRKRRESGCSCAPCRRRFWRWMSLVERRILRR